MTNSLQLIADDVASRFLSGLDSLHNLTRKVSEDRDLSPSEIERVAQLVNKEVQVRMYSERGPEGAFEFDMVSPDSIISDFNSEFEDYATEKQASSAYSPKRVFADAEGEDYTGANQFSGDFLLEQKAKLELDLEEMQDNIRKVANDIEGGYNDVYKIMKHAIVGEDATAEDIVTFVNQESPALSKLAASVAMGVLQDIRDQENLPDSIKVHTNPVPVDKFEGSQALIRHLNTLVKQHEDYERNNGAYFEIREGVKYVVEGINTQLRGNLEFEI